MPKARNRTSSQLAAGVTALLATPALAAPSERELADWLARNTDLSAAQVAIVAPEHVYSLQPLGPRRPSGEVTALVRTEVLAADWGASRGFQSWEAELLFDCRGGRVRILKSTVYPQPNRQGGPKVEPAGGDWFAPKPPEPAVQLLAAACDPGFVWPLRANLASPAPAPAKLVDAAPAEVETKRETIVVVEQSAPPAGPAPADSLAEPGSGEVSVLMPSAPATPVARAPTPSAQQTLPPPSTEQAKAAAYFVQVGRGPSAEGAKKALVKARGALGPLAHGLKDSTDVTQLGAKRRYTARLTGFPTAAAADEACGVLASAGQACFTRAERKP